MKVVDAINSGAEGRKPSEHNSTDSREYLCLLSRTWRGECLSHAERHDAITLCRGISDFQRGTSDLSYSQIGALTLVFQITASVLQPLVGLFTDRKPQPYSLPFGMAISMSALFILAFASNYAMLLLGGALLGVGSSIFHPETSRLARLASGGSHGLAQSIFQVGGNFGSSLGPLLMILLVLPNGQHSLAWFSLAAMLGIVMQAGLAHWYKHHGQAIHQKQAAAKVSTLSQKRVVGAIAVLVVLTCSKYFYLASITSYYVFYLMQHFQLPQKQSQLYSNT